MEIKVGFIGVGGIAQVHLKNLNQIDGVKIAAVCDANIERGEKAASLYGGKAYRDYQEMLKEELDALYICVPPFAHGEIELAAIERGLPFFVEKPIGLNLEKVEEIERKIREKSIITSVGYQNRYFDTADKLRGFLNNQKIGLVLGYWLGSVPGVEWWWKKETSGGQAVEQTTHIFDLARYFCGEVEKVIAFGEKGLVTEYKNYDIEDASSANLYFKSGAIGTIFSGCFLSAGDKVGIEIYTREFRAEYWGSLKIIEGDKTTEFKPKNEALMEEDKTFISAVRNRDSSKIRSDYSDSLKTLRLTLAVNESIEEGKEIKL